VSRSAGAAAPLDAHLAIELYERMLLVRRFEEKAVELFERGRIRGNVHPCIGQEAVSVGVCAALRRDDYMTSTHRGHGDCLAKGADVRRMMAELLGKGTGFCKGKGGSMHIADFEGGNLGANGIVGAGLPIAVGAGISVQNAGSNRAVVAFFGDGAASQGTFHESVNLAALWKLPVVFVCQNNQYAISTPLRESVAHPQLADRGAAYGIPGVSADGNDVLEVYAHAQAAVARARAGEGPSLLDCLTYRLYGHFTGDAGHGIRYRTKAEMEAWRARCPLVRLRARLAAEDRLDEIQAKAIEERVAAAIEDAVRFADASPWPQPEEALEDIFEEGRTAKTP
jgi:pyruvate dehydrogenase E1 component alpha subunit